MCLVISILLSVMAVNFYLNGFVIQAFTTGLMAVGFMILMARNLSCKGGSCAPKYKDKKKEEDKDDN